MLLLRFSKVQFYGVLKYFLFEQRLVLILEYDRELVFGVDSEAVLTLRKQVLSFCAHVRESKQHH